MRFLRGAVCLLVAMGVTQTASAIITYDNPTGQTTPPDANDPTVGGWAYVGSFATSSAVAIGPNHFIASKHQGGSVGGAFNLNGTNYTTISSTDIPNSDLRVWEVSGTLPAFAPLFTGDPLGKPVTLVGYGRHTLGAAVTTDDPDPNEHGWIWGATGGKSWGSNTIDDRGTIGTFHVIAFDFDPVAGEGTLAANDSGGGVFILDEGVWKLAGVHFGVEGPYNYQPVSAGSFSAAIYEGAGLFFKVDEDEWAPAPAGPQYALAMDISYYATDIMGAVPEPGALAGLAMGMVGLMIRRRRAA